MKQILKLVEEMEGTADACDRSAIRAEIEKLLTIAAPVDVTGQSQKLIDLSFALVRAITWRSDSPDRYAAEVNRPVYNELFDFLHNECRKPQRVQILIEASGGCIRSVYSNCPGMDVVKRDFDDIRAGDDDPLEENAGEDAGGVLVTDYDGAGYPYEVW